jgi:hypothetical protein
MITIAIHLIGTLAYSARIAGVRANRIALSFALFNILVLVSRTSNGFLGPLLAKRVEAGLSDSSGKNLVWDFQIVLASASLAVAAGLLLVPTGQRIFTKAIAQFQTHKSSLKLLFSGFSRKGLSAMLSAIAMPRFDNFTELARPSGVSGGVIISNVLAQALLTVGVLASIYAGYLNPEYRVTASQLSAVINGLATILLFAFIDPQLSQITDDVVHGQTSEALYRRKIVWVSISRFTGTIVAQLLFLPSAHLIALIANYI